MIVGILPRPKRYHIYKDALKEANKRLIDISRHHSKCTFVPIYKLFVTHDAVKPGLHVGDKVHLNYEGGELLGTHLFKRFMTLC